MATHKSVEERLAEAKRASERAAAKVRELEVRQRSLLARQRQRGEKLAMRLLTDGLSARPLLATALWELAAHAALKPEELAALALVIGEPPASATAQAG